MITVVLGIVALFAWAGLELGLRKPGEASTLRADARDRASTRLLVVAFAVAAILPIILPAADAGFPVAVAWVGVGLCLLGLGIRVWAMRTLGASYTRNLRTASDQELVTDGPYRWVRHPGYLGSITIWVGAALSFHSWLAAMLVAILMLLAYGWRITTEEAMLAEHFGATYAEYASHTARLVPGLY